MTKILVGFDDSSQSRDALRLAQGMAAITSAELAVACVEVDDPFYGFDQVGLEAEFEQLFERAARELHGASFIRHGISSSSASKGLDRIANDEGADLIVIGSTRRGTIGCVMPGTTGSALLTAGPCPIVVAPLGFAERERADLGLIGVGYDGTEESGIALRGAESWAKKLGASLRVIAALPPQPRADGQGGYMGVLRQRFLEVLEHAASEVDSSIEVETVLRDGDPAAVLAEQGLELDLLILGSRGYGPVRRVLLGGVSSEVIRTAPCPVLVVPRGSTEQKGDSGERQDLDRLRQVG